jgi:hypothetical protein
VSYDTIFRMLTELCSRWAARTQLSLEFPKGDPLETGISTIIHTHGLAVVLYMIGLNKGTHLYCRLLTLGIDILDETRFMYCSLLFNY